MLIIMPSRAESHFQFQCYLLFGLKVKYVILSEIDFPKK